MLLKDFQPKSFLEVPNHHVEVPKYPVLDIHAHFGKLMMGEDYASLYDTAEAVESLRSFGIERIVNLDLGFGEERDKIMRKLDGYEDFFIHFGTVDVSRFEEPDFEQTVRASIIDGVRNYRMRGIKLWKMIGLGYQDQDGRYLRPDDERLTCIYREAAQQHIPVLFHIADPVAFFSPVDGKNERYEELCSHPDWSFCREGLYSFRELMEMQEHMIAENPDTIFIIAHFGSYSENLAQVGAWLDRYPNMYVDTAARISELGRQPYTAKAFFEKYSDRILFGTDYAPTAGKLHPIYYRFFETMDEYFNPDGDDAVPGEGQGRWNIYGLGLPDDVLEKIYHKNAEKLLAL